MYSKLTGYDSQWTAIEAYKLLIMINNHQLQWQIQIGILSVGIGIYTKSAFWKVLFQVLVKCSTCDKLLPKNSIFDLYWYLEESTLYLKYILESFQNSDFNYFSIHSFRFVFYFPQYRREKTKKIQYTDQATLLKRISK